VPEISPETDFKLRSNRPVEHYLEAKEADVETRPVLIGPITFLLLSKASRNAPAGFEPLSVLKKLVPAYAELLKKLADAGAKAVQIDEPSLVMDATSNLGAEYKSTYATLAKAAPIDITITTYFGRIGSNIDYIKELPVHALHIDLDRAPEQLDSVIAAVKGTKLVLSLGLVSGRNIWKTDLDRAIKTAKKAIDALGADRVVVATSSSLLHTPHTLGSETKLTDQVRDWFAFAIEKAAEISLIALALDDKKKTTFVEEALEANARSIKARRDFETQSDSHVRDRLAAVTDSMYDRKSPFNVRQKAQASVYALPRFPTTTIGSFPQTKEIRQARAKLTKGEIGQEEYDKFIENEIETVVRFQEKVGLDILVHGEPERNDMVQYFGEQLRGFVFTENAWVQSYGSRYVRPPIIVSFAQFVPGCAVSRTLNVRKRSRTSPALTP
jgi:5-methyltetrahydropteroyltriglutamate--homocysteine methyltransferase